MQKYIGIITIILWGLIASPKSFFFTQVNQPNVSYNLLMNKIPRGAYMTRTSNFARSTTIQLRKGKMNYEKVVFIFYVFFVLLRHRRCIHAQVFLTMCHDHILHLNQIPKENLIWKNLELMLCADIRISSKMLSDELLSSINRSLNVLLNWHISKLSNE